jgi:alanine dehydrogenase
MNILWLGESEVKRVLDIRGTINAVEEAFRQHGLRKVQVPQKLYLDFPKYNGDLRVMPAYIESLDIAGVKIVNVHPDNPKEGLPTVMATVILNDPKTGASVAIMDGTYLTDMRTGASGGIAVKYLARNDSRVLGVIGSGRQAKTQLLAINEVTSIEEVKVASKSEKHAQRFRKDAEKAFDIEIKVASPEDVCDCDILVTTTPVRSPII